MALGGRGCSEEIRYAHSFSYGIAVFLFHILTVLNHPLGDVVRIAPNELVFVTPQALAGELLWRIKARHLKCIESHGIIQICTARIQSTWNISQRQKSATMETMNMAG